MTKDLNSVWPLDCVDSAFGFVDSERRTRAGSALRQLCQHAGTRI